MTEEILAADGTPDQPITWNDLAPTAEDWAARCDQQADELGRWIENFFTTVPEKLELMELAARLRLRAIELRKQ